MCYLIELSIPKAHESLIDSCEAPLLEAHRDQTLALAEHMPDDFVTFVLISGGCSCDLFKGPRGHSEGKERAKYKQKGWSDAKIERALKNREQNSSAFRSDAKQFIDSLLRKCGELALVCRWSDEPLGGTRTISQAEFLEDQLQISENEILFVG